MKYTSADADKNEVADKFLDFLLNDPRCEGSIAIAQNGSNFDVHFIIERLLARTIFPSVITRGNKVISMNVAPLKNQHFNKLEFEESFLLIAQPLAKLPEAFELGAVEKGEFPYLFNKPVNYGKVLDHLVNSWSGTIGAKMASLILTQSYSATARWMYSFSTEHWPST